MIQGKAEQTQGQLLLQENNVSQQNSKYVPELTNESCFFSTLPTAHGLREMLGKVSTERCSSLLTNCISCHMTKVDILQNHCNGFLLKKIGPCIFFVFQSSYFRSWKYIGCGKSRFTVVCMENDTIINR